MFYSGAKLSPTICNGEHVNLVKPDTNNKITKTSARKFDTLIQTGFQQIFRNIEFEILTHTWNIEILYSIFYEL